MNTNIKHKFNHKKDLIEQHLRYLFEQDTAVILRIQAIEFLYPYIQEDNILEKLEFFYKKERDLYIKTLLKQALEGSLKSYIVTDFRESSAPSAETTNPGATTQRLSPEELALLRLSSF
jgi:hypothetical protein